MNLGRVWKALILSVFGAGSASQDLAAAPAAQLSDETHQKIAQLSSKGDDYAERGRYAEAVATYVQALELVPEPITDWEASTWLLAAIGDAHFKAGSYEQARAALSDAMHCPGAIGNPFLHLRLGQAQFELGNLDRANDELARAYMGGGKAAFAGEHPKYFDHLKTVLKPPDHGDW